MNAIQEKVGSDQEETKAMINSVWTELEETMKHLVEDILAYVGQRIQGHRKELIEKIDEMQVDLEAVKNPLIHGRRVFRKH